MENGDKKAEYSMMLANGSSMSNAPFSGGQSPSSSGSRGTPSSRSGTATTTPVGDNKFTRLIHLDIQGDDAASPQIYIESDRCGEFFFFKVFKLDPKRRSQRYMAGQEVQQSRNTSSAAAVGAGMYDVGDAGDAAMSKYLQSTGMQHLASSSTSALDQKLIPNQLAQGSLWKRCILSEEQQMQQKSESPSQEDTMLSYVSSMEAALLPCLPARELQAIERSAHSSHQIDVERHARDFMEAAKKIQLYLISLQCRKRPTRKEQLQQEINAMEDELKTKTEMINKHQLLIDEWTKVVVERLAIHNAELDKV